jgi:hypothetical protein
MLDFSSSRRAPQSALDRSQTVVAAMSGIRPPPCEAAAAGRGEESALKSGLLSEPIARSVDALAALLRVSTLKLSTPVAEPQS